MYCSWTVWRQPRTGDPGQSHERQFDVRKRVWGAARRVLDRLNDQNTPCPSSENGLNLSGTPENSFKSYPWKPPNLVAFLVHHIHAIALTGDHWLVAAKRRRARMSEVPVPLPAIRLEIASPRWVLLLSTQIVSIHDIECAGFLQDMIEHPHSRIPPRLSFGIDIQAGNRSVKSFSFPQIDSTTCGSYNPPSVRQSQPSTFLHEIHPSRPQQIARVDMQSYHRNCLPHSRRLI